MSGSSRAKDWVRMREVKAIEDEEITRLRKDQHDEVRNPARRSLKTLKKLLAGRRLAVRLSDDGRKILLIRERAHGG